MQTGAWAESLAYHRWSRGNEFTELRQGRRARLDGTRAHHPQLPNGFDTAGGVLGQDGGFPRQHPAGCAFGIDRVSFAMPKAELTMGLIDLDDLLPSTQ